MSAHIGVDMYASCLRPFVLGEPQIIIWREAPKKDFLYNPEDTY